MSYAEVHYTGEATGQSHLDMLKLDWLVTRNQKILSQLGTTAVKIPSTPSVVTKSLQRHNSQDFQHLRTACVHFSRADI
eukprot:5697881-Amphidinium_carterae.2